MYEGLRGSQARCSLKFKRDRGLCEGFPYIDMENLQDHVFKTTNDAIADHHRKSNTTNVEDRVKALKELPKQNAFAFLQTVHQNMEGFTKHEVKGANLACKALAILGHPSSKELSQVVKKVRYQQLSYQSHQCL